MKGAGQLRVEAAAAAAVGALVRVLPRRAVLALGAGLGRLWAAADRRHVAIAVQNLALAFPEWSEARRAQTARAVYAHFGRVLLDLLWMRGRSQDEILALVDMEGLDHAARAHAAGRGTVFVCAHFGGWEIHGLTYPWLTGRPIGMIVRALDNPELDRRLCELRAMSGNSIFYKQRALQQVLKRLREGGSVAILVDQNVQEQDGIFVDFFGRPAATTTVAAALAVKTGCMLIPSHAELLPDGRYHGVCDPPIEWTPTGDRARDIAGLTQKMTTIIEGWVRQHPEQWLWMHRRWKTQPPSAPASLGSPEEAHP
jgi:KDO2-lipid IV(A) lauroyltransferase